MKKRVVELIITSGHLGILMCQAQCLTAHPPKSVYMYYEWGGILMSARYCKHQIKNKQTHFCAPGPYKIAGCELTNVEPVICCAASCQGLNYYLCRCMKEASSSGFYKKKAWSDQF